MSAWPGASYCRSTFTIGAHDNPVRRFGKRHFPVEETGSGKGGGLPRTHKDRNLGPQGRTFLPCYLRPAGGAGESLG